jgi:hypothetical protein
MSERVVLFGQRRTLVGTLTPAGDGGASGVAFVFMNAGVIGRVGPHRLNVKAARRVAGQGFPALRFDLSGLGDSRAAAGTLGFEQQAIADLREAMDFLQGEVGARRFVLSGLCSGADNSYAAALADERVAGIMLFDPYAYPTLKTKLRLVATRLKKPHAVAAIGRALVRRSSSLFGGRRQSIATPAPGTFRQKPPQAEFEAGLRRLVDRGTSVYLLFSGGMGRHYNYERQFADAFGEALAAKVEVAYSPEVNHTRTDLSAHRDLLDRIDAWSRRWRGE